jgi:hypothetical protein
VNFSDLNLAQSLFVPHKPYLGLDLPGSLRNITISKFDNMEESISLHSCIACTKMNESYLFLFSLVLSSLCCDCENGGIVLLSLFFYFLSLVLQPAEPTRERTARSLGRRDPTFILERTSRMTLIEEDASVRSSRRSHAEVGPFV